MHEDVENVVERTEPCRILFVICLDVEQLPLQSVYACLPERKLASHFFKLGYMSVLKIFLN